jgi:hypothetical protein
MHVIPSSPEEKAMLDAHLLWERMVIDKLGVQPHGPHELGLAPFAAGWEAGRMYADLQCGDAKPTLTRRTLMKRLIEEVENEGLVSLMGQRITLFCLNYIYTGKLVGVNDTCVRLDNPAIVYDTGRFDTKNWQDAQALPHTIYIMLACVESYGILKE